MEFMIGIGPAELVLILFVLLFALMLPIIALVDIVRSRFEGNTKLIWVIVVVFVHVLGPILYYAIGRKQKIARE